MNTSSERGNTIIMHKSNIFLIYEQIILILIYFILLLMLDLIPKDTFHNDKYILIIRTISSDAK